MQVYKTIGASFEFGGLSNGVAPSNRKMLMLKIVEFFGLGIVPVELVSFSADIDQNIILLKWETATETNNKLFIIERSNDNFNFDRIERLKEKELPLKCSNILSRIFSISSGKGKVYYRLRQVDFDGTENLSDVIEVDYSMIPKVFSLSQNYPNPFNPTTTIKFDIPKEVKVTLKMYDMLGAEVATLVDEVMKPGYYKYEWNASQFASGVYFYRISAGNFISSKKLILLR